jgi:hypothetical protein
MSSASSATLRRHNKTLQDTSTYAFSSKSRAFGPQLFWRSDSGFQQRARLAPHRCFLYAPFLLPSARILCASSRMVTVQARTVGAPSPKRPSIREVLAPQITSLSI